MASGYTPLPITPYRPQQGPSPLEMLAGIQGIKNQQLQGVALGQENQQRQIALQDQQAMSAAMHEWDGKDLNSLTPLMVKHGASANAVIGLKGKILEQQEKYSTIAKNDAETGSKNLETLKGKNDLVLGRINALSDVSDAELPGALLKAAQDMGQQGLIDPQHVQTAQQMAQSDPATIRKQLSIFSKSYQSQSQQMEQALKQSEVAKNAAQTTEAQANTSKTQRVTAGMNAQGMTAAEQGQQRLEGARLAETRRHNQMMEGMGLPDQGAVPSTAPADIGQVPPALRGQVQSIIDYRQPIPPSGRNNPRNNAIQYWVNKLAPDYDASSFPAKNKIIQSYTSGPESKSINAINTALGHLGELDQAAQALNQNNIPLLHSIASKLGAAVGQDAATTYQAILHRVGPEMTAAYVQGGGGEGERGANEKDFDQSKGAQQIRSNIAESAKLLRSKIAAQENQWNTTFRPTKPEDQFQNRFITPQAKETLNRLGGQAQQGITVTDPRGVVHTFPNQAAADAFKKAANIQ